ncbi:uncharacterized protein LOC123702281 [Colias croceus]|uniref:uncharacterized protein LOC123702281 n=1 Tax=Colias crocea TaxID=72248 RepID=UPI001E27C75C|nr:uncharacterized protein LOC123702281 [Colias croceus]XP_045505943.1 uncharacterized protein LOC123702281 [Colias croceus]
MPRSMVLIMMLLTTTLALEIKLEDLGESPGILPFKLGPMQLTHHYHTFLQFIELREIDSNISLVQSQLSEIRNKLDNLTYAVYESQIDYLSDKLDFALQQLKTLEPLRFKRGLIDSLGSVIKSITGNLDYSDAVKYDQALSVLKKNQDKIVIEQNHHISLSKDWMDEQNKIIAEIIESQNKINKTLFMILNPDSFPSPDIVKFAKFAQALAISSNNVDSLVSEISRLENALAFCSASRTHHSMIGIGVMKNMLSKLKTFYNKEEILDLEIRDYYDIIKPASYFNGDQLVFAFKFPIVSPLEYNFYKLAIVPNKNRQAIIPPSPFLAITGNMHVYIEAECPKSGMRYLCEDELHHMLKPQPDCISNIVEGNLHEERSCEMTTVNLMKPAMEKLDDRHYVVVFPSPTEARLSCEREEIINLNGSYLATIPPTCKLHTEDFTIVNTNDHIKGQPIKITKVSAHVKEPTLSFSIKSNSISLKKLHEIQDKIHHQEPIQLEQIPMFYNTTIPFYTILCSAIALSLIILGRRLILNRRKKNEERSQSSKKPRQEQTYAEPGPSQDCGKLPMTFFPVVQK